jgi:hypothetical protein
LNNNTQLFEFEWYLRDYLFRANNNNKSGEICLVFETKDIVNTLHEKYLRFKTWTVAQIHDTLVKVLPIMQERGALDNKMTLDMVILKSKLERRQCAICYYINCLGTEELKKCLRCHSEKLVEFPNHHKR